MKSLKKIISTSLALAMALCASTQLSAAMREPMGMSQKRVEALRNDLYPLSHQIAELKTKLIKNKVITAAEFNRIYPYAQRPETTMSIEGQIEMLRFDIDHLKHQLKTIKRLLISKRKINQQELKNMYSATQTTNGMNRTVTEQINTLQEDVNKLSRKYQTLNQLLVNKKIISQ